MAAKGEDAAYAAPDTHSDANSNPARAILDPDI
jgi:hypothetical protein